MERAREAVLAFFNARPRSTRVIFTAERDRRAQARRARRTRSTPGSRLLLTSDNHNSVNGIREFARAWGATVAYVPLTSPELRLDGDRSTPARRRRTRGASNLFAFPAQSNFSGVQHPLEWSTRPRTAGWDVLVDAAAFVPTNRLDLGASTARLRRRLLLQDLRLPDRRRLPARRARRSGPAAPAVVLRRHHHHRVRSGRLALPGRRRAGLRGRHRQLPQHPGRRARPSVPRRHRPRRDPPRVLCLTDWLLDGSPGSVMRTAPGVRIHGPHRRRPPWRHDRVQLPATADGASSTTDRRQPRAPSPDLPAHRLLLQPGFGRGGLQRHPARGTPRRTGSPSSSDHLRALGLESGGAVRVSLGVATTFRDVYRFMFFAATFCDR